MSTLDRPFDRTSAMPLPIVITHPERRMPLLVRGPRGCVLPRIPLPDGWAPEVIGDVSRALTAALKREALGLRYLVLAGALVCEAELIGAEPIGGSRALPSPFLWVTEPWPGQMADLDIPPADRQLLEVWFADVAQAPDLRAEWERPGWHVRAMRWIDARIADLRAARTSAITQVKGGWSQSAVLRAATSDGDLYFKAGLGADVETHVLTRHGRDLRGRLPEVPAADREKGWLLLRDAGGRPLDVSSTRECADAVAGFARLQIELAREDVTDHPAFLDCRPARLRGLYLDSLAPLPFSHVRLEHSHDRERLRAVADRIEPIAAALAGDGIPLTLVNRDFTPSNVRRASSGFVYFDWADTVVSHPFFSVLQFLAHLYEERRQRRMTGDPGGDFDAIGGAYLDAWRDFAPLPALNASLRAAGALQQVFLAIRWSAEVRRTHPVELWAGQIAAAWHACLARLADPP